MPACRQEGEIKGETMTATSQDKEAKGDKDSESKVEKPEATKKEPASVPLGEFIELRQQLRSVTEQLAKVQADAARAQEQGDQQKATQTPNEIAELRKRFDEQQAERNFEKMMAELSLVDRKQGESVSKLLSQNPGLTPLEALNLAAAREPDTFKDRGQAAGIAQFGQLRPAPSSQNPSQQPKESDHKKRLEYIAKIRTTDKRQAQRLWENHVGGFMAKAMGWEHQKIQIP